MWTYFVLLLAIVGLIAVFLRRVYLYVKRRPNCEEAKVSAIDDEEQLVKENVSRSDTHKVSSLLAQAESKLKYGKEDEAIKFFVQALAIDSLHEETQHRLAMLYLNKEMFGAASALFGQLARQTDDAIHYSHLGFALFRQNKLLEARDAYSRAISADPSRPQRFISLGQVYRSMEHLQNAIIAVKRAIEIDEENLDFLFLLADIQVESGNFEDAKATLEQLLSFDPKDTDAKNLLKKVNKALLDSRDSS